MAKRILVGTVVSNKMDKTVVVSIKRLVQHRLYKKTHKRVSKFKAHDENNQCSIGDKIKMIESNPISKEKRWIVLEILEKAR